MGDIARRSAFVAPSTQHAGLHRDRHARHQRSHFNLTQALEVAEVANDLLGIVTSYHNISVNCHYLNMTHMARQFAANGIGILRERSSELRTEEAQLYECILEYSLALAQLQIGDLRTAIRTLRDVQYRGEQSCLASKLGITCSSRPTYTMRDAASLSQQYGLGCSMRLVGWRRSYKLAQLQQLQTSARWTHDGHWRSSAPRRDASRKLLRN